MFPCCYGFISAVSFRSTSFKALVGQTSTQIGNSIFRHRSHFIATLKEDEGLIIPNGHTITHIQHAMQVGSFTKTNPLSGSLRMVPLGQAVIHGASGQCLHCRAKRFPSTYTRGTGCGSSLIASGSSLDTDAISFPHHSSHW